MCSGKPWHHCHPDTGGKCDGIHRCHKPEECEGKARRMKGNEHSKANKKKTDAKVTFDKVLMALNLSEEE